MTTGNLRLKEEPWNWNSFNDQSGTCYGYEIISRLEKWPILSVKENTVYPLLRRLLKEEYLSSSWQETTEGLPPRKYYSLTEKGREYLQCMKTEWKESFICKFQTWREKKMDKILNDYLEKLINT